MSLMRPDMSDEPPTAETPTTDTPTTAPPADRRRRATGAALLIGLLVAGLGFAIAVQVRQSGSDSLSGLREEDLIGLLDNQNLQAERLRAQIADLQTTLRQLQTSGDRTAAAQRQAEQEAEALAVLLGTVPAHGPGVAVTITDPGRQLKAEDLLDVIEELRGAGAEAIQIGSVRVSTSTAFVDAGGRVQVDGAGLTVPYRVLAIGESTTLDTALNIPGGVAAAVRAKGGDVTVHRRATVVITAVRGLPQTRYARPTR
jgi:uncharacterized protein YlxW (UPF0749 family)